MKAFKSLVCILIAVFAISVFAACGNMGGAGGSGNVENSGNSSTPEQAAGFTVSVVAPHNSWEVSYDKPIKAKVALSYDNVDPFDYAIYKDGKLIGPFYTLTESCSIILKEFKELELNTQINFTVSYSGMNIGESAFIPENSTVDFIIMYYLMSSSTAPASTYGINASTLVVLLNYSDIFDITVNGNEVDGSYVLQQGDSISVIEREVTYTVTVSVDGQEMKFNGYGTAFNFEAVLMMLGYSEESYTSFYNTYSVKINGNEVTQGNVVIDNDCFVELTTKKDTGSGNVRPDDSSSNPPEGNVAKCEKCQGYYASDCFCEKCNLCLVCCGGHDDTPDDPNPNVINVTIIINKYDGSQSTYEYETTDPIDLKKALHYTENDEYTSENYFWMVGYTFVDMNYKISEDTVITYVPSGFGYNVTYYESSYMTENGPASDVFGNVVPVPEMYLEDFLRFLGYDFKGLASQGYWMINNRVVTDPHFIVSIDSSEIYYLCGTPDGDTSNSFTVAFMVDGTAIYHEFTQPLTAIDAAKEFGIDITDFDLFISGVQISEYDVLSSNCTIYLKKKTDGCKHRKYEFFNRVCGTTNCDHNYCNECGVVFSRIEDAVGNYVDVICEICTAYVQQGGGDASYTCKYCGNAYKETDICNECGLCYTCCKGTHGSEGGENTYCVYFECEGNTYTYTFKNEVAIAVAATACGIDWQLYDIYLDGKQVEDHYVLTTDAKITLVRKSNGETGACQHANCTYYSPVCDKADREHYYCYDCALVVYRDYNADGAYASIGCEICTAHAHTGGDSPSEDVACEVTLICGEQVITYNVKANTNLKDFFISAEGLGYEFYESHTFTVDGKTVDGSFVITQSVTIIVT